MLLMHCTDIAAFRAAASELARDIAEGEPGLERLRAQHAALAERTERFAGMRDGAEVWNALGLPDAAAVSSAEAEEFNRMAAEVMT